MLIGGRLTPLERLFALEQFGIKLGLDNIRAILAALGNPERAYRSIHIAGTNGKGSVAAMSFTLAGVGSFSNFFGAFGGGTY